MALDTPYEEIATLDYKLYDYLIEIRTELQIIRSDIDALSRAFEKLRKETTQKNKEMKIR